MSIANSMMEFEDVSDVSDLDEDEEEDDEDEDDKDAENMETNGLLRTQSFTETPSFISCTKLTPRQKVVREIYATEESYLNNLRILVRVYVSPLRLDARGINPMLNLSEVHALFSDVEAVLRISEKVFEKMTESLEKDELDDSVGKIFCEVAPLLKLYTAYVNSHHRALETHHMLLTRPAYKNFCEQCKAMPECASCALDSFLILPVQRVPRYELLLKELLKHTEPSDPEHAEIASALSKVSSVALMINNNLRDHERRAAVLAVQEKFGNSVQLVSPQRWFVRDSMLRKVCKRKPKPFLFVLFNDVLVYGSQVAMPGINRGAGKKKELFKYHRMIDLSTAQVTVCPDSALGEPQFTISSPSKSFNVIAGSPMLRDQWVQDLEETIENAQRVSRSRHGLGSSATTSFNYGPNFRLSGHRSFTRKSSSGSLFSAADVNVEHAPVRDLGSDVNSCTLCATEFNYIRRRHQCRRCGIIVCDKCSPHRWRLRNLNRNKMKRICHKCFRKLTEGISSWDPSSEIAVEASSKRAAQFQRRGSMPDLKLCRLHRRNSSIPSLGVVDQVSARHMSIDLRSTKSLISSAATSSIASHFESVSTDDDIKSNLDSDHSFSSGSKRNLAAESGPHVVDEAMMPLPDDWREAKDQDGESYYWNIKTKEVTWDRPEFGPPPPVPPKSKAMLIKPASAASLPVPSASSSSLARRGSTGCAVRGASTPKPPGVVEKVARPNLPPRLPSRRRSMIAGELTQFQDDSSSKENQLPSETITDQNSLQMVAKTKPPTPQRPNSSGKIPPPIAQRPRIIR